MRAGQRGWAFKDVPDRICQACGSTFPSHRKNGGIKPASVTTCSKACGYTLIRSRRPLVARFWENVQKTDACWLWIGNTSRGGYGTLARSGPDAKRLKSHRFSWELHNGPIPDRLHVLHRCDNPRCVNPGHLFLGTHEDNMKDMAEKGKTRGSKNCRAKITEADVLSMRRRHASGGITIGQLANEYGLSLASARDAINGVNWRHVPLA